MLKKSVDDLFLNSATVDIPVIYVELYMYNSTDYC